MSQLFLAVVWIQVSADTSVMLHDSSKRPHYRMNMALKNIWKNKEKYCLQGVRQMMPQQMGSGGSWVNSKKEKKRKVYAFQRS